MAQTLMLTVISTLTIYLWLILILRIAGRRTLAQLSALDLVVLLLLGSAVETSMVHASTSLKVGIVSGLTLFIANFVLARVLGRSRRISNLVGGSPILLIHNGSFVDAHLRMVGLTRADVMEALRAHATCVVEDVRMAVLEPDGRINVVRRESPVPC